MLRDTYDSVASACRTMDEFMTGGWEDHTDEMLAIICSVALALGLATAFIISVIGISSLTFAPRTRASPAQTISRLQRKVTGKIDDVCAICKDDFTNPTRLPCKHVFCDYCIRLSLSHQDGCPLCRRMFFKINFHHGLNGLWPSGNIFVILSTAFYIVRAVLNCCGLTPTWFPWGEKLILGAITNCILCALEARLNSARIGQGLAKTLSTSLFAIIVLWLWETHPRSSAFTAFARLLFYSVQLPILIHVVTAPSRRPIVRRKHGKELSPKSDHVMATGCSIIWWVLWTFVLAPLGRRIYAVGPFGHNSAT